MLLFLVLGAAFGFILSRSGAADYDHIQWMFLLEDFQLYGIIGSAVVFTAPVLWLIRRRGLTFTGQRIDLPAKSLHRGNAIGGLLFGVGWSMAGMCPGPIFVNIGEGKIYAIAVLAGALAGAGAFGSAYTRLQGVLRLPPITMGAGEG